MKCIMTQGQMTALERQNRVICRNTGKKRMFLWKYLTKRGNSFYNIWAT